MTVMMALATIIHNTVVLVSLVKSHIALILISMLEKLTLCRESKVLQVAVVAMKLSSAPCRHILKFARFKDVIKYMIVPMGKMKKDVPMVCFIYFYYDFFFVFFVLFSFALLFSLAAAIVADPTSSSSVCHIWLTDWPLIHLT